MCGGWMVVPVLGILFVFSVLMYQKVYDESEQDQRSQNNWTQRRLVVLSCGTANDTFCSGGV